MRDKVKQVYTPLLYYTQLVNDKAAFMDTKCFETRAATSFTINIQMYRTRALMFSMVSWSWFSKQVIASIQSFTT